MMVVWVMVLVLFKGGNQCSLLALVQRPNNKMFFMHLLLLVTGSSCASWIYFTSGLRWSTLLTQGQITQNNIIFPLVAG